MIHTSICDLLHIKHPVIQGGMVYIAGAKLAAAVSNAGGLGVIGTGGMTVNEAVEAVRKAKTLTDKPFGVNIVLMNPGTDDLIRTLAKEKPAVFINSAGSPKKYTSWLKEQGFIVMHVTPTPALALKSELAGVDAVIVEGIEAGGHDSFDELSTMVLTAASVQSCNIPVIAAGGIANGSQIAAVLTLGAAAAQIGTAFITAEESDAHIDFKTAVIKAGFNDTAITGRSIGPVRALKNNLTAKIHAAELRGADKTELFKIIGPGRAKAGSLYGDIENGTLYCGQSAGFTDTIEPAANIIEKLIDETEKALNRVCTDILK